MPHVWQLWAPFIPEARRALDLAARFVARVTSEPRDVHPTSERSIA
jgi:hypothetical protein